MKLGRQAHNGGPNSQNRHSINGHGTKSNAVTYSPTIEKHNAMAARSRNASYKADKDRQMKARDLKSNSSNKRGTNNGTIDANARDQKITANDF